MVGNVFKLYRFIGQERKKCSRRMDTQSKHKVLFLSVVIHSTFTNIFGQTLKMILFLLERLYYIWWFINRILYQDLWVRFLSQFNDLYCESKISPPKCYHICKPRTVLLTPDFIHFMQLCDVFI